MAFSSHSLATTSNTDSEHYRTPRFGVNPSFTSGKCSYCFMLA